MARKYEIQLVHYHNESRTISLKVDGNHPVWKCLHAYYELQRKAYHMLMWEPTEFARKEREFTLDLWNLENEAVTLLSELYFWEDLDGFYIA